MNKKKITMILSAIGRGGAEKMMIHLANGFVNHGVDVELIVLRKKEGDHKKRFDPRVKVIILPKPPSVYLYIPVLFIIFLLRRPQRILSTQIHVNIITMLAALPLFLRDKVTFREANTPSISLKYSTNLKLRFTKFLGKKLYPLAKKYVAISQEVKTDMANFYSIDIEKINVIWSPVITKEVSKLADEKVQNEVFNKSKVRLICVGHIRPVKNYTLIIEAFDIVTKSLDVNLFILGKDSSKYAQEMKELTRNKSLENSIRFLGLVENPYAYMSKSDLLILASEWEGFGNVLVEALACGCPVISTDCPGGPAEILENGKYGKLVSSGDVEELANGILETLHSPIDKQNLKKRAQEFSQEKSVKKYIDYLF